MATITFHGVGIKAMSACVPPDVVYNKDLGYLIPEEEIEKVIFSLEILEHELEMSVHLGEMFIYSLLNALLLFLVKVLTS